MSDLLLLPSMVLVAIALGYQLCSMRPKPRERSERCGKEGDHRGILKVCGPCVEAHSRACIRMGERGERGFGMDDTSPPPVRPALRAFEQDRQATCDLTGHEPVAGRCVLCRRPM